MARATNKLNVKQVEAALKRKVAKAEMLADGGGLYLRLRPGGSPSWVFVTTVGGKRRECGVGGAMGANAVTLAKARETAAAMREAVKEGKDPRTVTAAPVEPDAPAVVTFGEFSDAYISRVEGGWKNPVHRQQWRNSLRDHAGAIRDKPIAEVDTADLLAVLQPIWLAKPETASRVRGRIEKILSAALAEGHIKPPYDNPARWRGHLEHSLGKWKKLARGHHAALPYANAPAFMAELRTRRALAARCLEFVILTAARSGEALGATWREIDLRQAVWTVPKERMKAGKEHRVPLSPAAMAVLEAVRPNSPKPTDRVFGIDGAARSNMAMAMLLRRMERGDLTVHGWRSTFRDWAGDATGHAHQVIEAALAHVIQNKAEAAYRRSDAFDKRRALMNDWADFLTGTKPAKETPAPDTDALAAALAALTTEQRAALLAKIGETAKG